MKERRNLKEYIIIIKSKVKQIGIEKILIIILCVVFLSVASIPTKKKVDTNTKKEEVNIQTDTADYIQELEKKLKNALSKVQGVGTVEVVVTLKSTKELVVNKDTPYTTNETNETDSQGGKRKTKNYEYSEETVYSKEDGGEVPFIVKELEPEVEGVLVIATGADNATVTNNIINGVMALVNIQTHKISVLKMNE